MKPFLSVVIPAYNESKRISNTILEIDHYLTSKRFKDVMSKYNKDKKIKGYEILVVDDGSSDNTVEIVEKFRTMIRNLKVIDNKKNHGKGYVVRQGMLKAKGKYRVFTDADNSTSIDHIEGMIPYLSKEKGEKDKYSIVICSRADKKSKIGAPQPFHKRLMGKLGNKFIQIVAVWGISDTQCGFKGFEEKAVRAIFSKTLIDRWGFDVEVLSVGRLLGFKIREIPVRWINDPNTHVSLKAYVQVLMETIKVRINIWMKKYN